MHTYKYSKQPYLIAIIFSNVDHQNSISPAHFEKLVSCNVILFAQIGRRNIYVTNVPGENPKNYNLYRLADLRF